MILLPPHAKFAVDGLDVHVFSTPHCELSEVRAAIPLFRETETDAAAAAILGNVALQPTLPSQRCYRDTLLRKGAEFSVSLMSDKVFISGVCPRDRIADCLFTVFQACLDVPTGAEFAYLLRTAKVHAQMLAEVPDIALHTENLRRRWGSHPFAMGMTTVEALQKLTHSDYAAFVAERIGVAGGQFVICTDIPDHGKLLDDFAAEIADGIRSLPTHNLHLGPEIDIAPVTPGTYQLGRAEPEAVVSMQLMMPAAPRTASDNAAFRTASTILGGYPNSRLLTQLRDVLGVVYQISSYTEDYRGAANLTISLKTPIHLFQETAVRLDEIVNDFVSNGPGTGELNDAVRYLINSTAVSWANPAGFGSAQAALLSTGVTLDYWDRLAFDLAELNVDDVTQAARRYMGEGVRILGSA
ncbi:M16 family metallopeptidase [Corynebacterium timonense]|uniref:Peptidase M16 inactive domain-containing protein n=1 Tax=Corynebacterium timonense TaxID=441500 RepID=A0A1H1S6R9_9CORY|nr:insulinase family protein [Corynebacterium timonense]SDS42979.1 Peptidase M16 inactive domain-containing protein [Corynebacterium timonense]